jgi:hypothetical protein
MTIYRGYTIEERGERFYVLDPTGELSYLAGPFETDRETFDWIDGQIRTRRTKP